MEEKEQIIKKIDELTSELNRQNLKIQTFTEIISHIRSRVMRAERRKKEKLWQKQVGAHAPIETEA